MRRFENILVGIDLSAGDRIAAQELNPSTREAIRQALWVAARHGAKVTFSAGLDICAQTEELLEQDVEHVLHSVDADAAEILKSLQAQAIREGVRSEVHLAHGHGWEVIIRKILRDKHDLVVAGTRNHTLLDRMLFGTTGVKLLRYSPCPVWLTKPGFDDRDDVNVLVADDFREVGEECLHLAVNGKQDVPVRTHILHVIETSPGLIADDDALKQSEVAAAEKTMQERLAATDYRTLQYGVQLFVKHGRANEVIRDMVEEHKIDLLIMGTAGRSGLSGFLFGNTVERLLSQIDCSVIALKPSDFRCPVSAG